MIRRASLRHIPPRSRGVRALLRAVSASTKSGSRRSASQQRRSRGLGNDGAAARATEAYIALHDPAPAEPHLCVCLADQAASRGDEALPCFASGFIADLASGLLGGMGFNHLPWIWPTRSAPWRSGSPPARWRQPSSSRAPAAGARQPRLHPRQPQDACGDQHDSGDLEGAHRVASCSETRSVRGSAGRKHPVVTPKAFDPG
jgi:hypothetical protein